MATCNNPITLELTGNNGEILLTNPNNTDAIVTATPQGSWPVNGIVIAANGTFQGIIDPDQCLMYQCGDVVGGVHAMEVGTPAMEAGPYQVGDTPQVTVTFTNTGDEVIDSLTVELVHPETRPVLLCDQLDFSDPTNITFVWSHDPFPPNTTQVNVDPRITINGTDHDPGPSHVYTTPSGNIVHSWDITQMAWYAGVAKTGKLTAGGFHWYNGNVVLNPITNECPDITYDWT